MAMTASSVQFRPQNRDLGMVMREVDEDLAIFLGIRSGEKERNASLLVEESDAFDDSKGSDPSLDSLLALNASQQETFLVAAEDKLIDLEMEMEKSDTNWLLTQPDTALLPSVEADVQGSAMGGAKFPDDEIVALKSEPENTCEEASASLSDSSSKLATSSDDRKPIRRAPTPIRRPSLPAKQKPSRPSTPTSRPTLPSSKPVSAQSRSSTPVGRASRSSTPSSRPSIPIISKSAPRSSTPTRKPTSSTVSVSKSLGPSHGTFLAVKSRPSKPLEMLSISQNAPQNPKVSLPKRPVSASRGRANSPAARSSSSNKKPIQKSCSPPKVRAPVSATVPYKTGSKILSRSRNEDDVNPVIMGTKMVDRVVNMRKLAPPKQDEYVSHDSNPRKSSQENSGFGRSLSKKSLDMALRHMDIRRSIRDKPRTQAAGSCKNSGVGASES